MNNLKNPLVIVANGEFPSHSIPLDILRESQTIVACDGASDELLKHGYEANTIIGDLDSISDNVKNDFKNKIIKIPDQSQNDLRKAINYVRDNNIINISIIGASGKREDHAIGNIFSILNYEDLNIKLFTNTGVFSCIHKDQKVDSFKGQQVSIFTSDSMIKITSKNLKYNFNNNTISAIYSGTLNESLSDSFELIISHGNLLIFQVYK